MVLPIFEVLAAPLHLQSLDDFFDLPASVWTPVLLLFLATIVLNPEPFVGKKVDCWMPQQYTDAWEEYTESYCFQQETFFIPDYENTEHLTEDQKQYTKHYAWSFVIFLLAAAINILPRVLFYNILEDDDLEFSYFLSEAEENNEMTAEEKRMKIKLLADHLDLKLSAKQIPRTLPRLRPSAMYFITKILYLLLMIGQFLFIPHFIGLEWDYLWSIKLCQEFYNGLEWLDNSIFPLVVFCDYKTLQFGEPQEHRIQCKNNMNWLFMWVFIFLSFWFPTAASSVLFGLIRAIPKVLGSKPITSEKLADEPKKDVEAFYTDYLGCDGKLLLHMMNEKNPVLTEKLTKQLFSGYMEVKDLDPKKRRSYKIAEKINLIVAKIDEPDEEDQENELPVDNDNDEDDDNDLNMIEDDVDSIVFEFDDSFDDDDPNSENDLSADEWEPERVIAVNIEETEELEMDTEDILVEENNDEMFIQMETDYDEEIEEFEDSASNVFEYDADYDIYPNDDPGAEEWAPEMNFDKRVTTVETERSDMDEHHAEGILIEEDDDELVIQTEADEVIEESEDIEVTQRRWNLTSTVEKDDEPVIQMETEAEEQKAIVMGRKATDESVESGIDPRRDLTANVENNDKLFLRIETETEEVIEESEDVEVIHRRWNLTSHETDKDETVIDVDLHHQVEPNNLHSGESVSDALMIQSGTDETENEYVELGFAEPHKKNILLEAVVVKNVGPMGARMKERCTEGTLVKADKNETVIEMDLLEQRVEQDNIASGGSVSNKNPIDTNKANKEETVIQMNLEDEAQESDGDKHDVDFDDPEARKRF